MCYLNATFFESLVEIVMSEKDFGVLKEPASGGGLHVATATGARDGQHSREESVLSRIKHVLGRPNITRGEAQALPSRVFPKTSNQHDIVDIRAVQEVHSAI